MKKIFLIFSMIASNLVAAQITLIPDPNFEQALIDLGIDSDGIINGQVLTADVENVVNLNISDKSIGDLTGIQDFQALEELDVNGNFLEEIDLSGNSQLKILLCDFNNFLELDVSNNPLLKELYCSNQEDVVGSIITSFDFSNNLELELMYTANLGTLESINLRNRTGEIPLELYYLCMTDIGIDCTPTVCIEVDDPNGNPYQNMTIHGNYYFSEDCSLSVLEIENIPFLLYPNPVDGVLIIEDTNQDTVSLTISDMSGKQFETLTLTQGNVKHVDLKDLPSGMYLLTIKYVNGNKVTRKLLKK